jgi:hypothetical protein
MCIDCQTRFERFVGAMQWKKIDKKL